MKTTVRHRPTSIVARLQTQRAFAAAVLRVGRSPVFGERQRAGPVGAHPCEKRVVATAPRGAADPCERHMTAMDPRAPHTVAVQPRDQRTASVVSARAAGALAGVVAAAVRAATIVAVAGVVPAAVRAATIVAVAGLAGCGGDDAPAPPPEFDWAALLPASDFPPPRVPEDNPMTFDKVELGRRLFYDRRLSGNETQSCGDCHQQAFGFSDGRAVSPGSTGTLTFRNSMQLTNVGYATTLTWGNPLIRTLEAQALIPMFGEDPIELGLASQEQLFDRLRSDSLYPEQFDAAFPDQPDPINLQNVTRAIAAFERTLVAFDSPYDRAYYKGDRAAMSEAAYRGEALFFSEKFECFHCHGGANFSAATVHDGSPFVELAFFNTGLYNIDGDGGYPSPNTGVFEITQDPRDMGRMRPPSLRNVAVSAPYMHDGSLATLDDVLDHYARGGTLREGNNAGDGAESPLKSDFLVGFTFEGTEREDLKAFLQALTDDTFLNNPALAPVN